MLGSTVTLGSPALHVTVTPDRGCDIRQIVDVATGMRLLWETPWSPQARTRSALARSSEEWLVGYPGGWQLLLPNAGAPCTSDGVEVGFHGEASVAAWDWVAGADTLTARLSLFSRPLEVERTIRVEDRTVSVIETVKNTGVAHTSFIWAHHPGFGAELLDDSPRLFLPEGEVCVDAAYTDASNLLRAGATGQWPMVPSADGSLTDLSRLPARGSFLCYVAGTPGVAEIRRGDNLLGARLTWDTATFPYLWLWSDLGGVQSGPWFGRGRVIGIEPSSAPDARGLAAALENQDGLICLPPGGSRTSWVSVEVLR